MTAASRGAPIVIAMGGNALLDPALPPTVTHQFEVTARAMAPVADLVADGVHLVLTHGNGPQVGFMQRRAELASGQVHTVPLDSLVADTQGSLGYMIQRGLRHALVARAGAPGEGAAVEVVSLVTEVIVDHDDAAFSEPTKPIGRFYDEAEAKALAAANGWAVMEDAGRGWRRVVPSPGPIEIVQLPTIRRLVDAGVTVIACGGGGVPVERDAAEGHLQGVEAVIDKDRTSALLAHGLGARRLIITTGVDAVYLNFRSEHPERLTHITAAALAAHAAAGEFPAGSMGPKIEAALWFLERGGDSVTICKPEALRAAYAHRAGTTITREAP